MFDTRKKEDEAEVDYKDFNTCLEFLKGILNQISPRFTKYYLPSIETESTYM